MASQEMLLGAGQMAMQGQQALSLREPVREVELEVLQPSAHQMVGAPLGTASMATRVASQNSLHLVEGSAMLGTIRNRSVEIQSHKARSRTALDYRLGLGKASQ